MYIFLRFRKKTRTVKKLRYSHHWYIDGTWIYPNGFKQLIIILYRDNETGKRFPALFALINNKNESGYNLLFKKIKEIITLFNTKPLNLRSFTCDNEKGLVNSLNNIYENMCMLLLSLYKKS